MGLTLIRHGSPEDRGAMDAYYGRDPDNLITLRGIR